MRLLVLVLLLLLPFGLLGQNVLTLDQAIEMALENNYGIRIAKSNQEIAENNYTLGNAGFLPVLNLSANQNNSRVNGEQIVGGETRDIDNQSNKSTNIGGNVNWTLFDGTAMFTNYELLRAQNIQSQAQLEFTIQTAIYNVTTSFYLASLENERLKLLQSNLELSNDRLDIAKDKYELGKGSKLEFLQAQVDYNTDQSNILNQRQILENQKLDLLRQIGVRDETGFTLDYEMRFENELNLDALLNSVASSTELDVFERAREIAEYQEKVSKANALPNLSIFAGYSYSETIRAVGFSFESATTDLSYGFNANFTLFNGFNNRRIIQNNKINAQIANTAYEQRLFELENSIRQEYVSYLNNIELIRIEEQNVEVAKENNDIAKERYDIGLSNAVEYRESQTNLIAAEIRKQNAEFAAKISEIELKYLAGLSLK